MRFAIKEVNHFIPLKGSSEADYNTESDVVRKVGGVLESECADAVSFVKEDPRNFNLLVTNDYEGDAEDEDDEEED